MDWFAARLVLDSQDDDAAKAISAITSEATSLGADGVINLHCLQDTGSWGGGYLCYALAIKLK